MKTVRMLVPFTMAVMVAAPLFADNLLVTPRVSKDAGYIVELEYVGEGKGDGGRILKFEKSAGGWWATDDMGPSFSGPIDAMLYDDVDGDGEKDLLVSTRQNTSGGPDSGYIIELKYVGKPNGDGGRNLKYEKSAGGWWATDDMGPSFSGPIDAMLYEDIDGDGEKDLLVSTRIGGAGYIIELEYVDMPNGDGGRKLKAEMKGAGGWWATDDMKWNGPIDAMLYEDIDGDGKKDLLVSTRISDAGHIFKLEYVGMPNGDGGRNLKSESKSWWATDDKGYNGPIDELLFADVDGDGKKDLLVSIRIDGKGSIINLDYAGQDNGDGGRKLKQDGGAWWSTGDMGWNSAIDAMLFADVDGSGAKRRNSE